MLPAINPQSTNAWKALQKHYQTLQHKNISNLFSENKNRTKDFSIHKDFLLYDFSRTLFNSETLRLFIQLAEECKLAEAVNAFKTGKNINETEQKQVLHFALRDTDRKHTAHIAEKTAQDIIDTREKMKHFTESVHTKKYTGYTEKPIKYIVNIGIGGSDLGTKTVINALKPYHKKDIRIYFVSNVDSTHLTDILNTIIFEETLFIIASKTFTTQETMENAHRAKERFLFVAKDPKHIATHFLALSANTEACEAFGIVPQHIFPFGDFIGGRFSLWSAIGLPIALAIGWNNFMELLAGAHQADNHFFNEKPGKNIPFLMAILGIWHRNFCHYYAHAIIPYYEYLSFLPNFLQQLEMESNGKSFDRQGNKLQYPTCPVIFGGTGTDTQHSFFQLLHQGTDIIPVEFIAVATTPTQEKSPQEKLLAHCFAQSYALMHGQGNTKNPYKHFSGNRPSTTLLLSAITPYTLGFLLALYEHKVFIQGILWNINSFDQFGVELGKKIYSENLTAFTHKQRAPDLSMQQLIDFHKHHTAHNL